MATNSFLNVVTKELTPKDTELLTTLTVKGDTLDGVVTNLITQITPKDDGLKGSKFVYQFDVISAGDPENTININVKYRELFLSYQSAELTQASFFTGTNSDGSLTLLKAVPVSADSIGVLYHIFYMFTGTGTETMTIFNDNVDIPTNTFVDQTRFMLTAIGDSNPFEYSSRTDTVQDLFRMLRTFTISNETVTAAEIAAAKAAEEGTGDDGSTGESKEEGSSSTDT